MAEEVILENSIIRRIEYIKAFNSDYVILEIKDALPENFTDEDQKKRKRGIYFAKVDFNKLENDPTLTLTKLIAENKKPIFEYSADTFDLQTINQGIAAEDQSVWINRIAVQSELISWDPSGNSKILAVALTLKVTEGLFVARLMVLVDPLKEFALCHQIKVKDPPLDIKTIIPENSDRAYVLYGSGNGLYGHRH